MTPGSTITITATGSANCSGDAAGPDGGTGGGTVQIQNWAGISGYDAPGGSACGIALSGVFTGPTVPLGPSAPARLDFTTGAGEDFSSVSPLIAQGFFIGDGLTGTGTGDEQLFVVPAGATTLWLGVQDGQTYTSPPGYYNDNTGGYTVTVTRPTPTGATYVALGDSYSSGEGAPNSTYFPGTTFPGPGGTTQGCHRSTNAYALTLAAYLRLSGPNWQFVACSGAVLADLTRPNPRWLALPKNQSEREPAQLDAVDGSKTTVATMTNGGNDVGFEWIMKDCTFVVPSGGSGAPGCSSPGRIAYQYAQSALVGTSTSPATLAPALLAAYERVAKSLAPQGRLYVAGYPRFFGTNKYLYQPVGVLQQNPGLACNVGSLSVPIAILPVGTKTYVYPAFVSYTDATWIDSLVDLGNQVIHNQIDAANRWLAQQKYSQRVVYVPIDAQFHGHRLCDTYSSYALRGNAYLNGVLFPTLSKTPMRQSFHPDKAGQAAYARAFEAVIPRPRS